MHLKVGLQRDAASMNFEAEQAPAVRHRLCAPAGGSHNSRSEFPAPSRAQPQFATEAPKFTSEPFIQNKTRDTQCSCWKRARPDHRFPVEKCRAPRGTNACLLQPAQQTESSERALAAATDEFAADAVSRIASRFPQNNRHAALAQTNTQRKAGQSTAYDGDALSHFFSR